MKYDNERDRLLNGFDAGNIIDGRVTFDPDLGRYVLVDDENIGFDIQAALESLSGKEIRMTIISFESIETLENLIKNANETITHVMVQSPSDLDFPEDKE